MNEMTRKKILFTQRFRVSKMIRTSHHYCDEVFKYQGSELQAPQLQKMQQVKLKQKWSLHLKMAMFKKFCSFVLVQPLQA